MDHVVLDSPIWEPKSRLMQKLHICNLGAVLKKKSGQKWDMSHLGAGGKNFGGLVSHLILGENYFIFKNV